MDDTMLENESYDRESNTITSDVIGKEEIKKAMDTLKKYKKGKTKLEEKIVKNEQWWKLRHWDSFDNVSPNEPKPTSGWLFNCIMSKHADFMDSYPAPVILPREIGDKQEATVLSSIIPVILEQNDFEAVYSDETMYKLKNGTGCYGIFWDNSKLNGLGDIAIKSVDLLSLFWEPGVTDIQKSRNLFHVELVDNDVIMEQYPVTKDLLKEKRDDSELKKYLLDDTIDTSHKSMMVDWYYKKNVGGKDILHYCKFVDEIVLYATENDTKPHETGVVPMMDDMGAPIMDEEGLPVLSPTYAPSLSERGWYDHGKYPFVFDVLFKEEGTPIGFGFVDVCKNPQMSIDIMNNAIEKAAIHNATPRYFYRQDGSINAEELLDFSKPLVKVSGNLGEDSIRPMTQTSLDSIYVTVLNNKIEELKETAGNRDTANGGTSAGVTAASAIAAMQEQSGKTSRDMIKTTYRAYANVITQTIELIRQFYDENRQFRILGERGKEEFITYNNMALKEKPLGMEYGVDMGVRLPVFDIKVSAQKASSYSQLSQNELALQFYNSGFFNPQNADMVLACLDMMEFDGKDEIVGKIEQNGGMYQQMIQMQQQMLQMAQIIDRTNGSNLAGAMAQNITGVPMDMPNANADVDLETNAEGESSLMTKAREQSQNASRPR